MALTRWFFSYDIGSDKARRRASKMLERHGERILYSVYAPVLADGDQHRLVRDLSGLLSGPWDSLLAVPCCSDCGLAVSGQLLEAEPRHAYLAAGGA